MSESKKDAPKATPVADPGEAEEVKVDMFTQESEVLVEKMYSDDLTKLKSLDAIQEDLPEQNFYIQKSNLSIFRYEDVIFNLFPHLGGLKRRGATCQ